MITEEGIISILIPTLNAGNRWSELLESINEQSAVISEKIIIDSGSDDYTVELALAAGFKVYSIKREEFNHGKIRQDLVDLTSQKTDICVFLTQDAILDSPDSIVKLVKGFQDAKLGMAYGRQLPHNNAKPIETHLRLFNYPAISEVLSIADAGKRGFKIFFCSNSFAAYRKSALYAVGGFPSNSIMGEDAIVAAKMLEAGFKKAYVAEATVRHSHSYAVQEEFKRYFDTRVFHEQNTWLLKKYGKPTGEGIRYVKSEFAYILKNRPFQIHRVIGALAAKWLGYSIGKFYDKLPISLVKKLSMHHAYWRHKSNRL